jgi:hypothetical protein
MRRLTSFFLAYRGEIDSAFEWLEKARLHHDTGLKFLFVIKSKINPTMLSEPRRDQFMARPGMPPAQMNAIPFDVRPPGCADR